MLLWHLCEIWILHLSNNTCEQLHYRRHSKASILDEVQYLDVKNVGHVGNLYFEENNGL